ncbi:four helix bundle protein [Mariprofundus erugo]|uniref:four helix bundle protein n=1 Tax=Mariprofundus erugo TaxID=2528639 RepID=UPI0010FCDF6B|nr:four helix bundle protein [Mariprofundus erugo]TLS78393.1 four helix bundle protein [Mariprofundus erugo]
MIKAGIGDDASPLSPKSSAQSPARISRFEDLIAWQKARELTRAVYEVTSQGEFARDHGLRDQIRRAAVSVMSNLAEGFDRGSRADFHKFIVIAKGSCAEVRCQLYVALDAGYLDQVVFSTLQGRATEVARIIAGLRRSVEKQKEQK